LSGGQRQRVAMGRAIVRDPKVFLFDEPLSNLDAKLRVQMRTEIKELHQRLKTTTVYVTHDQIEAMTMADKIVVMQGGRIEQVGAPLELYDRPANIFVASFIGSPSMNLIDGVVKDGMVDVDGARLALPPGSTATEGQKVVYGVRPETFTAGNDGLAGTIAVVEPTGSETHVVVRIAGREVTAVFRERVSFRPGETITLAPDATQSHIFDKASGQRLA
jgi:multiple sugar transport system ATP-binding protein